MKLLVLLLAVAAVGLAGPAGKYYPHFLPESDEMINYINYQARTTWRVCSQIFFFSRNDTNFPLMKTDSPFLSSFPTEI